MSSQSDEEETSVETKCIKESMVEIFESSTTEADLTDLIQKLSNLYDSSDKQEFEENFQSMLKIVISENKRSKEVENVLSFVSEFIITLDNKYKAVHFRQSMEDIEDVMHPLLKYLSNILECWSRASSYTVRFRSCQLLYMILSYIQENSIGEIDLATYEIILKVIETRRMDVSSNVRAHAVLLAKFFQDPTTSDDPVIAGLCWQLQNDPNALVRQNIAGIIAACEETVAPIAKRFLFDKNGAVRNAALLHICNRISARSFTAKQRILMLNQCFIDPSKLVRQNGEQKLIPLWFNAYNRKLCRFFKALQIGHESLDNLFFIPQLLKVLLKSVKMSQVLEEIDLDPETHLPKSSLSGEKVFLWRHFYRLTRNNNLVSNYFPPSEDLIDFILKQLNNSSKEDDAWIFNELVLFLTEIITTTDAEKCVNVFPVILNLMKNPFVPCNVMPYVTQLYIKHSPKVKDDMHNDIANTVEDLLQIIQFTPEQEKNILLNCFAIVTELLIEEHSNTTGIRKIKTMLIDHHLSLENEDLKFKALKALSLYCEMDVREAKLSWPLFANAIHIAPSPLRTILLKGAFDILKYSGLEIFADLTDNGEILFNEAIDNILLNVEDDENDRIIMIQGILKLYIVHHTASPDILSKLILMYFHPDKYRETKKHLEDFFQIYGGTMEEAECLNEAFLCVIDLMFDSNKNCPYHKVSTKNVAFKLQEFFRGFDLSIDHKMEEKFQNMLILKLTDKFLIKPWRLPVADLYSLCNSFFPKDTDTLLKLKDNIKLIVESLQLATFQQKNPFSKKCIKQFAMYSKKIQVALDTEPVFEDNPEETVPSPLEKQLFGDSYSDNSCSAKEDEIFEDSSPIQISPPESLELSIPENPTVLPAKTPLKDMESLSLKTPSAINTSIQSKTPLNINLTKTPSTRRRTAKKST